MNPVGLSSAEANQRLQQGLNNRIILKSSRSSIDIFKTHFLSLPNIVLILIMGVLIAVGKPIDALVSGGVVIINIFLATIQEFQAKRKLDQIALLARPHAVVMRDGVEQTIDPEKVVVDDVLVLRSGDQAVVDGTRIMDSSNKRMEMDESLLTGESDLITKQVGDSILSGSFCVVGEGYFVAEKVGMDSFAQKLTVGAREYTHEMTPLQWQVSILVRTVVILAVALSILLALTTLYHHDDFTQSIEDTAVIISLVPQGLLLMVTVSYALGAIRIGGRGAIVQQINAVESLSNVDVICLDKTGTLTTNRILLHGLHPFEGITEADLRQKLGDFIASMGVENRTAEAIHAAVSGTVRPMRSQISFSSSRKWSAGVFNDGMYVLGAPEMLGFTGENALLDSLTHQGLRVLLLAYSTETPVDENLPAALTPLGLVSLSDELRPSVHEVLDGFRAGGIALKLISGDNLTTVTALAYQAGFLLDHDRAISGLDLAQYTALEFAQAVRDHNIFGRITPDQKEKIVEVLRQQGHYVAMMGDGVNDVLSLKKAQVGIAMEDGSQATRSVADIILMGNKFEVLPEAFLEGQRILNAMNDTTRVFLTRTFYLALLIVVVGFMGVEFPLSPRHNYLIATLPVGTPAVFLTLWAKVGVRRKSLLVSLSEFVIPAGFSMTVVTVFIWLLYLTYGGEPTARDIEVGRTVLTVAAIVGGLWIIVLSGYSREDWKGMLPKPDMRRVRLALAMGAIFLVILLLPPAREFFELTPLSPADMGTIVGCMSAWAVILYGLLRFDLLERLLIPNFDPKNGYPKLPSQEG